MRPTRTSRRNLQIPRTTVRDYILSGKSAAIMASELQIGRHAAEMMIFRYVKASGAASRPLLMAREIQLLRQQLEDLKQQCKVFL